MKRSKIPEIIGLLIQKTITGENQFTSEDFTGVLNQHGIRISMLSRQLFLTLTALVESAV